MESKKGFFDILFVLIIFLFFLPTSIGINKSKIIPSNIVEIDTTALLADSVIVDAISDQSFNSESCEFSSADDYNTKVLEYLNTFEDSRQNYFGSVCTYELDNISLNNINATTKSYIGDLNITCTKQNNLVKTVLTKKLSFNKNIIITKPIPEKCNIKIKDDLQTNYYPLDQNQSIS